MVKSEILSSKSETNSNIQNLKLKTCSISNLGFLICFGFRISCFGFLRLRYSRKIRSIRVIFCGIIIS